MPTLAAVVEEIRQEARNYTAAPDIQKMLSQKTFVALVSPFAVGKTTLLQAVERYDSAFKRVRSITTRARRNGEDDDIYNFLPHDLPTLQDILRDAQAKRLVQLIVHPTTGNVYGSRPDAYSGDFAMLDTIPDALATMDCLSFKSRRKIGLATSPEVWAHRFAERIACTPQSDISKRLKEGVGNLEWLLDQGDSVSWVLNGRQRIDTVAMRFTEIVKGVRQSSVRARREAERLLKHMRRM